MDILKYRQLNQWQFNPHYLIPAGQLPRRFIFGRIINSVNNRLIVTLEGPRRLGKTTLLLQVVDYLLKRKVDPRRIHLYEFSEIDTDMRSVFKYAVSQALDNGPLYLFLDEAQYCLDWQVTAKHYYDLYPNLHILATGSTSLYLNQAQESLLGRRLPLKLGFLTFREYLHLAYRQQIEKYRFDPSGKPNDKKNKAASAWQTQEVFYEYLQFGEIPALLSLKGAPIKNDYLAHSVLDLFFSKDLALFSVSKPREMRVLYKSLAQNCAQVLNKNLLASRIKLSRPTIDRYVDILADSGMIGLVNNYYRSLRKQEAAHKKVFFRSINLMLQTLGVESYEQIYYEDFKGHVFENSVYNQLAGYFDKLYFWNRRGREVDFLAEKEGEYIPIEVKKTDKAEQVKLRDLLRLMRKFGVKVGWVVYSGESAIKQVDGFKIRFVNAARI